MINKEEIDKAIGAHGMWKARLKQAIETGKSEVSADTIRQDNQCNFGKWLYGTSLSATDKSSAHYRSVRELHAEFHKCAARVADLAVTGQKDEAVRMLALGGDFASVSSRLTAAMMEWKKV
ncbi:MAG: CZB domain-containing protein [Gammaproteobacteria bacterium]|nr:CZB domain-containing protein [Gammaproteobacteria bacterium]